MLVTLAAARQKLWQHGSNAVYPGTQAQSDAWDLLLNQVCEELIGRSKPRYTMRRVNIPIYDEMITLPRQYASLHGFKLLDEEIEPANPRMIYGRYFEFSQPHGDVSCCPGAIFPATDVAQTFRLPTPGFYLRCIATAVDDPLVLVGGRDANYDEYFGSVNLAITNGTTTTTRYYTSLPIIHKPATASKVELYSVTSGGAATLLAVYAPDETVPAYKRYLVPDSSGYPLALCHVKLGFVPATANTDIVYPSTLRALQRGLRAMVREEAEDEERAEQLWAQALNFLDAEVTELEGDALPVLNVTPGYGPGSIPFII